MRVGHFVSNFPREGQIEVYGKSLAAYNLCLSLARRGHDIEVFTISRDRKDSIEHHKGLRIYRKGSIFGYGSERFSFEILLKPLHCDLDIVHIHSGISFTTVGGFYFVEKKRKPLVVTWHGDSIAGYGRYQGVIPRVAAFFYNKYLVNKILSKADAIISPSIYYIDESAFLSNYREKVVEIPNGISLRELDVPYSKDQCRNKLKLYGKQIVLFVGSLYPHKGPDVLLRAIPRILRERKDTFFVFIGGGNIPKYQRLSEQLDVQRSVRFTGYVSENLKHSYYRAADIFVLPSVERFEVCPLVLLEASAFSLPLVVSDLNTFKSIVKDKFNGLFFKMRDEKDLSDKIAHLLEDNATRQNIGKHAKENVISFSWESVARDVEDLYRQILEPTYNE